MADLAESYNHSDIQGDDAEASSSVSFCEDEEKQTERKKYLTMKYGQHQIKLIQKRLRVEFWIDAELTEMYNITDANDTYDAELDVDELLDMEDDVERESFMKNALTNCPQPPDVVQSFIDRALARLRTL